MYIYYYNKSNPFMYYIPYKNGGVGIQLRHIKAPKIIYQDKDRGDNSAR